MIALVAVWLLIAVACIVLGHAVLLAVANAAASLHIGDRVILTLWLGLIAAEWLALLLSLWAPVTPATFFPLIAVIAIAMGVKHHSTLVALITQTYRDHFTTALVIVLVAAGFTAAGLRPTPDTGEYHYPAIRWLLEYGTVSGVAHIMTRLGYVTGVWALVAPFEAILPGRSLAAVNGFILCLLSMQILVATTRLARRRARPSDWFLATASFAILALGILIGSFSTPSPDLSVAALTVLAGWSILLAYEKEDLRLGMVPLMLSGGALIAKLSGVLLVPVAGLLAVASQRWSRWLTAAIVTGVLVAPYFAAAFLTSGCFAMPSAASCLPVSWAISPEDVRGLARGLWEWSRWGRPMPAGAGNWDWLADWFSGRPHWLNVTMFWFFASTLIAYFTVSRGRISRAERWVFALILPSIVLVFVNSPDLRFNFGLFVTPAALLAARLGPRLESRLVPLSAVLRPAWVALALACFMIGCSVMADRRHDEPLTVYRLLLPRAAPIAAVEARAVGGIAYAKTTDENGCWGTAPPCSDHALDNIVLRDPARGIAGGFRKAP